jgi:serine phosphatase RsbU (regulator of sigma subunit)
VGVLIDLGVAKTNKYASRESGDTVEVVERPTGGISVVVADGQGSGRPAKALSLLVTARAAALLKDGVRDGAAARAVSDTLFAMRHGQVSATLDILSVDARTESVLATRFGAAPMLAGWPPDLLPVPCAAGPLGVRAFARPDVQQWDLQPGFWAVVATDGVIGPQTAGEAPPKELRERALSEMVDGDAQAVADALLAHALARNGDRPKDDMSVVVLRVGVHDEEPRVRRLRVRVPLP